MLSQIISDKVHKEENRENVIQVSPETEKETDKLLQRFDTRYKFEKGKGMTPQQKEQCWWTICGVVMQNGNGIAKEYVDTVKIGG